MNNKIAMPLVLGLLVGVAFGACNCDPNGNNNNADGGDGGNNNNNTDGGNTGGGTDGGTAVGNSIRPGNTVTLADGGTCQQFLCGNKSQPYICADCDDDDGDGLIDAADPDCLGPCHDRENDFDLGINAACGGSCTGGDCYFDGDNGPGNDGCTYSYATDPLDPWEGGCAGGGTYTGASDTCRSNCGGLTPNGCDCYGCCTVYPANGSAAVDIFLGSQGCDVGCNLQTAHDSNVCKRCTKRTDCGRSTTCGTCQLCLGKTTLPPECFPDAGTPGADAGTNPGQCPGGEQACGLPGQPACPGGSFCLTGCCIRVE